MKKESERASAHMDPDGFSSRKECLTDYLLKKRSLRDFIRRAAEMLRCPIILTTSYYRVLALEDCGFEVDDPVWRAAKETGYCSSESVALFETEGVTRQVLSSEKAFLLDEGLASRIPRILQKVMVFGKPGAYIGLFQMDHPFDRTDLDTADLICDILSAMLERDPKALTFGRGLHESILCDLADGAITSPTVLNDRLRAAFWEPYPVFRCILVTPGNRSAGLDNADYLSYTLMSRIPHSLVIRVKEGLLLLLNEPDEKAFSAQEDLLRAAAEKYNLYLNAGNDFRSLIHLRSYYETCVLTHQIAKRMRRPDRLTRFSDVVFPAIAEKLRPEERLAFAQSAYKKLAAYDRLHETEYCRTLKRYIECGCIATAAAASLYVHRNTMTKRLTRISEICGISLSDGPALIHFYLTEKLLEE